MSRRRANIDNRAVRDELDDTTALDTGNNRSMERTASVAGSVAISLFDYTSMVSLVLGGCCTNVWTYEQLLRIEPHIGSALTFSQMLFIALQQLPYFITWNSSSSPFPSLRVRQVPLSHWLLQVVVLAAGSLLNNWAFAFSVPLSVQIVFRSAGLAVSMVFGQLFLKKVYSVRQMLSVALVTIGVIAATLSKPSSSVGGPMDMSRYTIGVLMLTISLFCTGALGLLQEQTYQKYGPCWREGVFYTHAMSLPIFLFFIPQVTTGLKSLHTHSNSVLPVPHIFLFANLVSQLVCVSGVNQLSSQLSSVSTQVVLTTRKAISLCISVWWFNDGWSVQLGLGASMVFIGSMLYTFSSTKAPTKKE